MFYTQGNYRNETGKRVKVKSTFDLCQTIVTVKRRFDNQVRSSTKGSGERIGSAFDMSQNEKLAQPFIPANRFTAQRRLNSIVRAACGGAHVRRQYHEFMKGDERSQD